MPRIDRSKRAAKPVAAAVEPEDAVLNEAPPRVHAVAEVADREERKRLLSGILRDHGATGAEKVASGRLLEAMERTDSGSDQRGLPPPTNKAEQTARLVRILTAAGPSIMLAAMEILARRRELGREVAFKNRAEGLNPMSLPKYRDYKTRIIGPKRSAEEADGEGGDDFGPGSDAGGAAADGTGVRELQEPEDAVESAAESNEYHGKRDTSPFEEV